MDPVTHALSGVLIRQIGFKQKAALPILVLSAIAPDLDYAALLWGSDAFLRYHRGITHGFLALAVFPLIMGLIFRNKGGFFSGYLLAFLGYGSHLLLDLMNHYGTQILSPLDWNRYSLDLTCIVDPYISIGVLAAVVIGRLNKKRSAAVALIAVVCIAGYLGGKSYLRDRAKRFLKTKMDANIYRVYPLPGGAARWWFVTRSGDEINTGIVDLFLDKVFIYEKHRMNALDPAVIDSKRNPLVKSFLALSQNPYAEVKREGGRTVVTWKEPSYAFLPGERFFAEVVMDGSGKAVKSVFKF